MAVLINFGIPWPLVSPKEFEAARLVREVVCEPPHPVVGILPQNLRFKIRRTPDRSRVEEYEFEGRFPLGWDHDFCGEYSFRLVVDVQRQACGVLSVAEMSLSVFERKLAIVLAQDLASSLPDDLQVYGADHDREWLMAQWEQALPETVFVI